MRIIMHCRTRLALLLLAGFVLALPAHAQIGGGTPTVGAIPTGKAGGVPKEAVKTPEPAALPGARSSGGPAPLTKAPSEMGPTEALFDAVNRGDRPAVQEAVTRGADLNARNVLGLTALELAIDLSNNDVAFLLLSLRDAGAGAPRGKGTKVAAPAAAPAAAKRPVPAPVKTVAAVREAAPRQHSDGGAPVPSAGFLGFGGGR
jgi:hypothetical protein